MSLTFAALILAPLWLAAVVFLRVYRIWLLFYMIGAAGCAYWIVLLSRGIADIEPALAYSVAWSVHGIAELMQVPTRIFEGAPGVLLVMVISQDIGWTALQIGVESSALLEISVFVSLVLFYPGWTWRRRSATALAGVAATWLANVVRMLVITFMLHDLGKNALVLAHTYVGKAIFFLLTVAIYWYLITGPSVRGGARPAKPHRPEASTQ
jgi:exosortase family protein XrtG